MSKLEDTVREMIKDKELQEHTMDWKGHISGYFIEDFLKCSNPTCGRIPTHYCCTRQYGNETGSMVFCKQHYDQIMNIEGFREYGFEETNEYGIPIISCYINGNQYMFYCPYCGKNHGHGIGDGHVLAHCNNPNSPYKESGYILRLETDEEKESRIVREKEEIIEIESAERKWKDMVSSLGLDEDVKDKILSRFE